MNRVFVTADGFDMRMQTRLRRAASLFLNRSGCRNSAFHLLVLSGRDMRLLKRRAHRVAYQRGRMVDVLAFPATPGFPHPETRRRFLGEVYVNRDAYRNPPYRGFPLRHVLLFLVAHGLLHLRGFDHHRKSDMLKMERAEKRLLRAVGVARLPLP